MPRAGAGGAAASSQRPAEPDGEGCSTQGCGVLAPPRRVRTRSAAAAPLGGELTVCLSNIELKQPRGAARPAGNRGGPPPRSRATRAAASRLAAAAHNEHLLLLLLDDGPLARVLAELQARDLARLECVCRFFGGAGPGGVSLIAATAAARLPPVRCEMPPWFAALGPAARLWHIEQRSLPLSPAAVAPGLWLRVRADAAAVQALCEPRDSADEQQQAGPPALQEAHPDAAAASDDDDVADAHRAPPRVRAYVGWNDKMRDTLGRCFPVLGQVDHRSWDVPVVGLRVPRGWACVAPPFGRRHECRAPCTGGWFYPLQALERI